MGKSPLFVATDGGIDRIKIGNHVFANVEDRKVLESILHPMVCRHRDKFLATHRDIGSKIVALDVPLLFETGGDVLCDHVIVVWASEETVWKRAIKRIGMTEEKLSNIIKSQMPAAEKRRRADFVLDADRDPAITRQHLFSWLDDLLLTLEFSKGGDNA